MTVLHRQSQRDWTSLTWNQWRGRLDEISYKPSYLQTSSNDSGNVDSPDERTPKLYLKASMAAWLQPSCEPRSSNRRYHAKKLMSSWLVFGEQQATHLAQMARFTWTFAMVIYITLSHVKSLPHPMCLAINLIMFQNNPVDPRSPSPSCWRMLAKLLPSWMVPPHHLRGLANIVQALRISNFCFQGGPN